MHEIVNANDVKLFSHRETHIQTTVCVGVF